MNEYEIQCALQSVIGTREEQQDYATYKQTDSCFVAVVCDGMGGLEGGYVASKCAAETLVRIIEEKNADETIPQVLLRSVDVLDEQVFGLKDNQGKRLNAGTTLVAVVIENDKVYWLSVGDSRLYIVRDKEMVQATRDHNYSLVLDSLPSNYIPTEEELSKKEALISFVGMGGIETMDLSNNPLFLQHNDKLLLTTDGLFKALTDEQIKSVIEKELSPELTVKELINQTEMYALEGRDNTTVIYIKIKGNKI